MISGHVKLIDLSVCVLFDTGATHSIVSEQLESRLKPYEQTTEFPLVISTPMGGSICLLTRFSNCSLLIGDCMREVTLLAMHMSYIELILGMDWLSRHRETTDCNAKQILFGDIDNPEAIFQGGTPKEDVSAVVSITVKQYTWQSNESFLSALQDPEQVFPTSASIHVVSEYLDVFPDDLPGIPLVREVEFTIDLVQELLLYPRLPTEWLQLK
ncbi:uncharacterized protein LOC112505431 [Cynara cardunculus var. scolymus]|uniref:uncharacterized protein LOC112505431 n=1 Tax=Cynara cardunculus var. scolymus TaxID=59895 RepID=UPI000D62A813|nr:uncharacterized protein LOC112505431 [Cynara cardunculus var. scolymus]